MNVAFAANPKLSCTYTWQDLSFTHPEFAYQSTCVFDDNMYQIFELTQISIYVNMYKTKCAFL